MKRFRDIIILLLILFIPLSLFCTFIFTPSPYSETYYGEMPFLFEKLNSTSGKKIVIIGNSAVAFGVRSDLLEKEFDDYSVVNFGLYGSLGTKFMLDLSKSNISEGDIIVIMPEPVTQSSSLYFSGQEAWRAIDTNFKMIFWAAKENMGEMCGAFLGYVQEKMQTYMAGDGNRNDGVYSKRAFVDEEGIAVDYVAFNRPYNVMEGGYDPTTKVEDYVNIFGKGYFDYLNEYNEYAKEKGATVYYSFCPLNSLAYKITDEDADELYRTIVDSLDFEVIGHPQKTVLDYGWFYDNNVHLNSPGACLFTDILAEDIKLELGIYAKNSIYVPDIPAVAPKDYVSGDNTNASCFIYSIEETDEEKYVRITGLTEEGKGKTVLVIPHDYEGIVVREFTPEVFNGDEIIAELTLGDNIANIYDDSFNGAIRLSKIIFEHDSILGINAGENYLRGADNCKIYIKSGVNTTTCAGGWEKFKDRIVYY